MKRFIIFLLAAFLIVFVRTPSAAYEASEKAFDFRRIAVLDMSAASDDGAAVDLGPAVCFKDENGGVCGAMFDALVFDAGFVPKTPVEAENFIRLLFEDTAAFAAAESAANDLRLSGKAENDRKYPIFVALPYFYGAFEDSDSRSEFCEYFVRTLIAVFNEKGFDNIYIAGISFGIEYDAVPDFRADCIKIVGGYNMLTLAFTTSSAAISCDACFTNNENFDRRLTLAESFTGPVLRFVGASSAEGGFPKAFDDELAGFKASSVNGGAAAVSFDGYDDFCGCAYGLVDGVPGADARGVYEDMAEFIGYSGEETSAEESDASEASEDTADAGKGRVAKGVEYWVYAAISVASVVCLAYVIAVLIKKGKKNDK